MSDIPKYRPKQLSLGPLEAEILNIVWDIGEVTVKDVHDRILQDPNRELAYSSVTTVLGRLAQKGWLTCNKSERTFTWQALISRAEAQVVEAYERLHKFLAVGNPDIVASFADSLDTASLDQIAAIALRLQAARAAKKEAE